MGEGYLGESEVSEGPDARNSSSDDLFKAKAKPSIFPNVKTACFTPRTAVSKTPTKQGSEIAGYSKPYTLVPTQRIIEPRKPIRGPQFVEPNMPQKPIHSSKSIGPSSFEHSNHNRSTRPLPLSSKTNTATQPKIKTHPVKPIQHFNPSSDQQSYLRNELNRRFLESTPKGSDDAESTTVRAEIHQHQHTHQHTHRHTITAQPYQEQRQYPSNPSYHTRESIPPQFQPPSHMFRPTHPLVTPYANLMPAVYSHHGASPYGVIAQDHLSGLQSGYHTGFGAPPFNPLLSQKPFRSNLPGAFQPKQMPALHAVGTPSISLRPHKRGRWCTAHASIASQISIHKTKLATDPTAKFELPHKAALPRQRTAFQSTHVAPGDKSKIQTKQESFGGLGQTDRSDIHRRQSSMPMLTKDQLHNPTHRSRSPIHRYPEMRHIQSQLSGRSATSLHMHPVQHFPPSMLLPTHHPSQPQTHSKLPHAMPQVQYLPDPLHISRHARMTELSRPPDYLLPGLAAAAMSAFPRPPVMYPTDPLASLAYSSMYRPENLYVSQPSLYPALSPHLALHNPYRPPNPRS